MSPFEVQIKLHARHIQIWPLKVFRAVVSFGFSFSEFFTSLKVFVLFQWKNLGNNNQTERSKHGKKIAHHHTIGRARSLAIVVAIRWLLVLVLFEFNCLLRYQHWPHVCLLLVMRWLMSFAPGTRASAQYFHETGFEAKKILNWFFLYKYAILFDFLL